MYIYSIYRLYVLSIYFIIIILRTKNIDGELNYRLCLLECSEVVLSGVLLKSKNAIGTVPKSSMIKNIVKNSPLERIKPALMMFT